MTTVHVRGMLNTKATNIHSEYLILLAFPRQQWLHDRASNYVIIHGLSW